MATDTLEQPLANGTSSAPHTNGESTTTAPGLSADEIALYDRQIRLWGAKAQESIRSANVLLVSLRALGTEIAKNLTLAGISSLTIIDDEPVTEEDLGAQYFIRDSDIGTPRAEAAIPRIQELNPRVKVQSGGSLAQLLTEDQNYYKPYSIIIACDHDLLTLSTINTTARFASVPFYAAGIHGMYGYIFADLLTHEFVVEREKSNIPTAIGTESLTRSVISVTSQRGNDGKTKEIVRKREQYCPLILANSSPLPSGILASQRKLKAVPALLPCLRALFDFQRTTGHFPSHSNQDLAAFTTLATAKSRELQLPLETLKADFLHSFIKNLGAEIVPTAAFVGGRLAEDVINVLGQREQPIQNFAMFDGEGLEGRIYSLWSAPPEVVMAGQSVNGLVVGGGGGLVGSENGVSAVGNGSAAEAIVLD
ncbi:E1 ubiquitin-activating protein aos1 [Elasticomyces elasticus]|nr:E1 ubiquitin-activating protein aos1 [Elasticomyces elasticus]KAK3652268.1 E1 ubiquitin-activating protein aos1 [Elasticomyces elasticus]KAK4910111.1 E1 ubiquitin-activating protein aos1 [Elasticomyces elasticus]KAK5753932.1 E1 ubiquitin-activating protein aos1 [Elasticomyces elasticus]